MPSLPHEYESVSDIQMNQLERGTGAAIENMEDEEEENNEEEEVVLNIDTPPSQVNDAGNDPTHEAHSHLVTSGNYSSLVDKQTSQHQPTTYSQLATILPVVPNRNEDNSMEQNKPHTYYNIQ